MKSGEWRYCSTIADHYQIEAIGWYQLDRWPDGPRGRCRHCEENNFPCLFREENPDPQVCIPSQ
jgi:hypothetical protein